MNKSELLSAMADITGAPKTDTERFLNALIETVEDTLKSGEEIKLIGFGTFCTAQKKASMGRNPRTSETIKIPERTIPKFKPGQKLKDCVSELIKKH